MPSSMTQVAGKNERSQAVRGRWTLSPLPTSRSVDNLKEHLSQACNSCLLQSGALEKYPMNRHWKKNLYRFFRVSTPPSPYNFQRK